jgi:DNA-binding response OmpR family regulator
MGFGMKVLLVEDDDRIADALIPALLKRNLQVDRASDAASGMAKFAEADLVLLDMGLPDRDGLSLCRAIREVSTVPIVAVTARREESSIVAALGAGVDDYVTKPYSLAVLMARIDAVMRRVGHHANEPVHAVFGFELDAEARQVTAEGEPVLLTRKEFDLLEMLVRANGGLVTREALMQQVWDTAWVGASRTLDVHVATLRAKLGDVAAIETVRGFGYRLPALEEED